MEVAHAYLPVGDHVVGGDWHDIVPLPGGRAALIVGEMVTEPQWCVSTGQNRPRAASPARPAPPAPQLDHRGQAPQHAGVPRRTPVSPRDQATTQERAQSARRPAQGRRSGPDGNTTVRYGSLKYSERAVVLVPGDQPAARLRPIRWLLEHVAAGSRGERRVLAVAEGGPGRLLGAGAGDQPLGPGPPPRALL